MTCNLPCVVQLGDFLEELFAKAVVLNLYSSELCICSFVSCRDSKAGVNVDEVQLSTILLTMNVCRTFLTFSFTSSGAATFRAW